MGIEMNEDTKMLAENGYLIYESTGGYTLHKVPTPKNNMVAIETANGLHTHVMCDSYQAAVDVALASLGLKPKETYFAAEVRFDRGLGWESRVLDGVMASKVSEARVLAREQADRFFRDKEEYTDVLSVDVRIRPHRLD